MLSFSRHFNHIRELLPIHSPPQRPVSAYKMYTRDRLFRDNTSHRAPTQERQRATTSPQRLRHPTHPQAQSTSWHNRPVILPGPTLATPPKYHLTASPSRFRPSLRTWTLRARQPPASHGGARRAVGSHPAPRAGPSARHPPGRTAPQGRAPFPPLRTSPSVGGWAELWAAA